MEKLDFNENQSVFRVGESSDKMFLLVKGKVGESCFPSHLEKSLRSQQLKDQFD